MWRSIFIVFICLTVIISGCTNESSTERGSEESQTVTTEESTMKETQEKQNQGKNIETIEQDIHTKLDNAMNRIEEYYHFSGTVYVGKAGEEIYSKAFGMADYENQIPNSLDTKFIMASLTKQFTAVAILMLEESGLLNVDDPITTYFPEASQFEDITIHQLLSMQSGIVNTDDPYLFEKFGSSTTFPASEEIISAFNEIPLHFNSGERYEYSNSNYILLGLIIEKVSGMTYEEFLEKNIFQPLGMNNSGYSIDWNLQQNKALGYEVIKENEIIPSQYEQYFLVSAAGGLYTSASDLAIWDRALYTDLLLKKETIEKSYVAYVEMPYIQRYGYGYGWMVNENQLKHSGLMPGYTSIIYRDLDSETVIILFSNNELFKDSLEMGLSALKDVLRSNELINSN
ncbi:serine hydrolase domain-containing protein [Chengkuizengella axinellae]|uniref:Serine hydrolase domain-containing protein n=1 Tax=Chengkuizengella axinellae TaxID=3064388 RepID=A0ABT9IX13_9BACL|nr:serine hydrolase domain-containing protein [Chengkuizengella sp. 2205SS18-9]MDP5273910.1 serine hydrolase domain-containing protein [Chengkuizengella sp. 2205SS18-9]